MNKSKMGQYGSEARMQQPTSVGASVGEADGERDGRREGAWVGMEEGELEGRVLGTSEGAVEGDSILWIGIIVRMANTVNR